MWMVLNRDLSITMEIVGKSNPNLSGIVPKVGGGLPASVTGTVHDFAAAPSSGDLADFVKQAKIVAQIHAAASGQHVLGINDGAAALTTPTM